MNIQKSGFTLIELLITMAIIAILALVVTIIMLPAQGKARYARMVAELNQLSTAARMDYQANLNWAPDTFPGVAPRFATSTQGTNMILWPATGPCPGWNYDWDNWLTYNGPGANSIRITVRSSTAPTTSTNSAFYICLQTTGDCAEAWISGWGAAGGGADVRTTKVRQVNCQ